MKKILALLVVLCGCGAAMGQNSSANVGGVNFSSGASIPAACTAPSYFFKTSATQSYSICIGGTYSTLGALSLTFPIAASAGTLPAPSYAFSGATGSGMWLDTLGPEINNAGIASVLFLTNGYQMPSGGRIQWSSGAVGLASDTGISRVAAKVVAIGTGAAGNTTGTLENSADIRVGTKFTSNAGCSETTLVGGATAGKFTSVSTACTVIVTMGDADTAPNGWACSGYDITTPATGTFKEVATGATTASFTLAVTASDVIIFQCIGF